MLYHFSNIDLGYLILNYSTLFNPGDYVILDKSVVGLISLDQEIKKKTKVLKELCLYSKNLKIVLIVALDAITDQMKYSSTLVIDSGRIIGITNAVNVDDDYCEGKSLDYYNLGEKRILIIINNDALLPNIIALNQKMLPRLIFHIDQNPFCNVKTRRIANLAIDSRTRVYSLYSDTSIAYGNDGSIIQIEVGELRRFNTMLLL